MIECNFSVLVHCSHLIYIQCESFPSVKMLWCFVLDWLVNMIVVETKTDWKQISTEMRLFWFVEEFVLKSWCDFFPPTIHYNWSDIIFTTSIFKFTPWHLWKHTNTQEFCPHRYFWRHDGNQRRWADKDITTARQTRRSLWDALAEILLLEWFLLCFFLAQWNSILLMFMGWGGGWGGVQTSKNANESQISCFGHLYFPE